MDVAMSLGSETPATAALPKALLSLQVLRGAAEAGVPADVISRCSSEVCDPAVVAAILGEVTQDPYYCYFYAQSLAAPELPPSHQPIIGRDMPAAQASPFGF